ncbi:MAG: hypothetical protein ACP5UQ_06440 [Anaerolineae bacterium]
MLQVHVMQLLLGILIGLAVGLILPGLWRSHHRVADDNLAGTRDDVLLGLLVLAAFALGVFTILVLRGIY